MTRRAAAGLRGCDGGEDDETRYSCRDAACSSAWRCAGTPAHRRWERSRAAPRTTPEPSLPGVTVEVSSPALIEKVRIATTDSTGLYRIVNLPPGTYTVTFTLTGFNTYRREGVEVSPGFTATIDGDHAPRQHPGDGDGHRREPGGGPAVRRAAARGDGHAIQGTAVRRLVDSDGRAHVGGPRARTRTSAASSAIRPAHRSARTAAAKATASRWWTACASATCISART